MILTITMNPSIDSIYFTKHFELGTMTRFASPVRYVGGKRINCGRASALLGSSVILTGFLGGYFGGMIQDMLQNENLFDLHFYLLQKNQEVPSPSCMMVKRRQNLWKLVLK
ncbi:hypothetical protein O3Q50_01685 [Enterococcus lactis]